MSIFTAERAVRSNDTLNVRPLLARSAQYVVPLASFAAYLGSVVVREQFDHTIDETVKWSLAMFDARTMSNVPAAQPAEKIGEAVEDYIEDRISTEADIELKLAIEAVLHTISPIYGQQLRITGWLPGFRIAEGRKSVIELSGDTCPSCAINPTGYRVGDHKNTARCLNSEDCGWTGA
ncbi:hypothetical protein SAMN06295974_3754 [Plantibacter flavus]|uniref:Uncharacterized protein n=1 Tax=Plantibacter flavus TaxID=150123 RepID=A0A3N2BLL9_9MICO|nr:hypothetical protein [Plantibacter flavus]ROR76098.1 hypothetical protein EDD42_4051 [Plantibacter flavus]SMG48564.1 hypothetical protein SAMN06295974_3754 [Plantibacter flavus]